MQQLLQVFNRLGRLVRQLEILHVHSRRLRLRSRLLRAQLKIFYRHIRLFQLRFKVVDHGTLACIGLLRPRQLIVFEL